MRRCNLGPPAPQTASDAEKQAFVEKVRHSVPSPLDEGLGGVYLVEEVVK